jgi:hypothetical protein
MSEVKLISLETRLFDGMQLGGIKRFKMKPTQDKIVILGSNGAGKSRLLKIIPPHAVSPVDLEDGGSIEHIYEVDTVRYRFLQEKKGKNLRCSIWKGDEVIVENANPTVYNDSVTKIIGYDKKVKELLTSLVKFTEMRTPERRFWFGQLAESDLSTALKYYKVLKEMQRDNSGAIKVTERYVADMKPLVLKDADELEALNKRLSALELEYEEVNKEWLQYRNSNGKLDTVLAEMESIAKRVWEVDSNGVESSGYYHNLISELSADLNHRQNFILPRLNKEITDLDNKIKEAEYYSKNLDVFEERITETRRKLETLKGSDNVFLSDMAILPVSSLRGILARTDALLHDVHPVLSKQTTDEKISVLRQKMDDSQRVLEELKREQLADENIFNEMKNYIVKHNHTEDTECPQCKTVFKPGFTKPISELEERMRNASVAIDKRRGLIEAARETHTDNVVAHDLKTELASVVQRYQEDHLFRPLISQIMSTGGFHRGLNLKMWIDEYSESVRVSIRMSELTEELERLEKERLVAAAASGLDKEGLVNHHTELSQSLQKERERIADLSERVTKAKDFMRRAQECEHYQERLEIIFSSFDTVIEEQGRFFYSEFLNKTKDELWGMISGIRERKIMLDKMKDELKYNEDKLVELRAEKDVYDETVREMSPSDGILAEYLYRSIYAVTDSMNLLIDQVFVYPLVVKPCDVENGELDYQFPFIEGESGTQRFDISVGSDAQKEIFNATFLLSAIQALDLKNQPLLMDEPGRTMDVGHKNTYSDFIASLYDTSYCSQLFVVSHNKEFHSRLGAVDYIVINEEGVDLPDSYNTCVEIEYE